MSPLTEATFYILISLLEPLHGYGIMQKVVKLSRGRIHLAPGTLYGALANLVDAKLIVPEDSKDSNPRRKTYHITSTGKELIEYEVKRLEEIVKNARYLLKKEGIKNG
jgi:DNA-binding PadR family transcriptional regulator